MTEFEKTYQNYNPRQAALDEARALLTAAAKAAMADGALPEAELPAFIVEIPADVKNGDIASNIAMAGARSWRKAPRMIADALLAHLPAMENSVFAKVEVAGPGFINLFLSQSFWAGVVLGACANREYGRTDHGKGAKYNVEFVSANPTGPMHMGNARGGALGDCLAAVLDWSGYDVTREFYINDAGNQIQKFGKSLAVRYLQQFCGEEAYPLPAECYQGGDIKVLAKAVKGSEVSIFVGVLAAVVATLLGTALGACAGFFGGRVGDLLEWVYNVFTSIPGILLIFAFAAVFGRGIATVVLILGLTGWTGVYRLVRAEYLKHASREYVRAAQAIGASTGSRMFRHILPNISHVILVQLSILTVGFIKAEVILSYLGLGVPVDQVSWGTMLAEAQSELILGHWWQLAAATLFMAMFVTAFSLMADALRDALDPKLRGLE